jgi:hypothetical protein
MRVRGGVPLSRGVISVQNRLSPWFLILIILVVVVSVTVIIVLVVWKTFPTKKKRKKQPSRDRDRLCMLAYYEKDETYKQNLEYFLQHGVYPNMDYLIIVNGICTCTALRNEKRPNVKVMYRENTGYDFGAYSHALSVLQGGDSVQDTVVNIPYKLDKYRYFFFINSSVRGPFVKPHLEMSDWSYQFTDLLKDDVHLVGTTICILHSNSPFFMVDKDHLTRPHVQSMVLVMDRLCLDLLLPHIFNPEFITNDMWSTIINKEILLSTKVLEKGWNISCLAAKYQGFDYRKITTNINYSAAPLGDACHPGAYFGGTLDPYEIVFIKTNRGLPVPP